MEVAEAVQSLIAARFLRLVFPPPVHPEHLLVRLSPRNCLALRLVLLLGLGLGLGLGLRLDFRLARILPESQKNCFPLHCHHRDVEGSCC